MDDADFLIEYDDDIANYEDKYADELDALNEFEEDFPVIKSKASRSKESGSTEKQSHSAPTADDISLPSLLSQQPESVAQDEADDEFLQSIAHLPPKSKRLRVEEETENLTEAQEEAPPIEIKIPALERYKEKGRRRVFRRPPYGKDCITTTDSDGKRVFLQLEESTEEVKFVPKVNKCNLLATPFAEIKQIVDEKRHADVMKQANALKDILKETENDSEDIFEHREIETGNDEPPEEALWVEKYTAKQFTELLSDDGINRVLLKWLKLWDKFVFGKTNKTTKKQVKEIQQPNEQKKFGKRKQTWDYEEELEADASGRPVYRIALLSGNPGLGKTTLAHVLASHAGYNPVEMNASDDRSPELFKNKLEAATQMKACMGDAKKPNCLIIDEIDGAPIQAINILTQAAKETDDSLHRKKKKTHLTLTRPVICICNNLYVPALRQLRQISLSLTVPQISPGRLAQRLIEISRKESMRADMACLLALCDKSENDIRSCINTMQFMCKKHGELKGDHLRDLSIGQKDFHKDLFFVLKNIFQLPKPSRKSFLQPNNKMGSNNPALAHLQNDLGSSTTQTSNSIRFHNILHLASSNSEYDRMTQGLFDNYLNMKSKDPHLETIISCGDWFQFADHIDKKIRSNQTFALMKFFPFLPAKFHMSLAGALAPKINYLSSMVEFNSKLLKSKQILESLVHDVRPNVRRNVAGSSAILDLLPYLYEIMQPSLRPVNIQLYSQSEKQQLLNVISTMISYNLTYNQERNMEGNYSFNLQPNIEEIIGLPGLPQHKHMSYAAKQLVQREIDLEKMRRIEQSLSSLDIKEKKQGNEVKKDPRVPQALQPLKVKPMKRKPVLDFFGRVVRQKEKTAEEKLIERKSLIINTTIWFKFNAGYTNAVRRTTKVQDFL